MNVQGFSPLLSAPMLGQSAIAAATGTGTTTGTTSTTNSSSTNPNGLSSSDIESTFLNLLVTELQNQDPTQPVDPTEMVGQMVSLNQLDQLISINQTLTSLTTPPTTTTPTTPSNPTNTQPPANDNPGYGTQSTGGALPAVSSKAATSLAAPVSQQKLPIPSAQTPAAWMNLYGNIGMPATYSNHFTAAGGR
ncbi:MAG: flagellar hook capping FlgD N-terminal domain-containing protein [Terracidiphilus sp.]